ncbi:GNAT family N-acetyltransferase [Brassicibacter mesophilus]|uniref:GNAT family N-acetyltransferase n=1 Tax=Brassicibacter mesophilus TaxID=745119 RepID=UPI003D23D354
MKYFKKLVGDRIYLSPLNTEDAEKYAEWLNDLEMSVNLQCAPRIITSDKKIEVMKRMINDGNNFAIVDLKNDELIGNCGLMFTDFINGTAELGILIGNPNYLNNGFGTEAINLLLDYGFNLLNLNNIILRVLSFNKRAIKCYEKCGFKIIGRRRESVNIGGEKYDDIYMDILNNEFKGKLKDFIKEKVIEI